MILIKTKKSHLLFTALLAIATIFSSCGEMTEEIYLNKDGSGEYLVYMDVLGSTRMMMKEMMTGIYPDLSEDSLNKVMDAQIWEQFPAEIDSLIDIVSTAPDSVKNDPAKMKYLSRMIVFMKGGKKDGFINSGVRFKFKSMKDLEGMQRFMQENENASQQTGLSLPDVDVKYRYDGKSFSRITQLQKSNALNDSTLEAASAFLKNSRSRLILHLPKEVKKATKDRMVSSEGKEVIYEFDFLKVLKGEQSSDFKIDF